MEGVLHRLTCDVFLSPDRVESADKVAAIEPITPIQLVAHLRAHINTRVHIPAIRVTRVTAQEIPVDIHRR